MFDAINIATSGMAAFSRGLSNISNNVANLNTVGYKRQALDFQALLANQDPLLGEQGNGVTPGSPRTVFLQGELRSSGNSLDAGIDGSGYFVVQNAQGQHLYSRDGQFEIDSSGTLVARQSGLPVMVYGSNGQLSKLSIANERSIAGVPSTTVKFDGSLSTGDSDKSHTISDIGLYDTLGVRHAVSIVFNDQTDPTTTTSAHRWNFTVNDDASHQLAQGQLVFGPDGSPEAGSDKFNFTWNPAGSVSQQIALDFGSPGGYGGLTSFSVGTASTAKLTSVDGAASGSLSSTGYTEDGSIVANYSNGQKKTLGQLALAFFMHPQDLLPTDGNLLKNTGGDEPELGRAGAGVFGKIAPGQVEASNVDLTQQFSELIIVQRAYQASSQVISTANDMMQQLFDIGGRK